MPDGRLGVIEIVSKKGSHKAKLRGDDRRAQAAAFMARRLMGESNAAIARDSGLSMATVSTRLELARQDGVPGEARRILIDEMLPQALVVMQEALRSDDLKLAVTVAMKLVDGLKVMDDPARLQNSGISETLESFRLNLTRRTIASGEAASGVSGSSGRLEGLLLPTLEATVEIGAAAEGEADAGEDAGEGGSEG